MKYDNVEEAARYLPKVEVEKENQRQISDTKERLHWAKQCRAFAIVLADAVKLKDRSALEFVAKECEDEVIRMSAEKALSGKLQSCLLRIKDYCTVDSYQFVSFFLQP